VQPGNEQVTSHSCCSAVGVVGDFHTIFEGLSIQQATSFDDVRMAENLHKRRSLLGRMVSRKKRDRSLVPADVSSEDAFSRFRS